MRADKLKKLIPVRAMIIGYPGSGKTGALASLANAGFKLRVLDYDGNPESLLRYTRPEMLKNIDIVSLEDPMTMSGQNIGPLGTPTAFVNGFKMMARWRYEDPDGETVDEKTGKRFTDLGPSDSWGPDTIVVLDGLTGMGEAAMRRARGLLGKTLRDTTDATWGLAMNEQAAFVERLTSADNRYHSIVISHIKMVGPKAIRKGDDSITEQVKREIADLVPTRLYPSALGWQLPQNIAQHFPTVVEATVSVSQARVRRKLSVQPKDELDLKYPGNDLAGKDLGIDNGMLEIFAGLGWQPELEEKEDGTGTQS